MASLRKRLKSDHWVCCYTTADGQRIQRSVCTTDKDEAWVVCRHWQNEANALRENGETTGLQVSKMEIIAPKESGK